jgi:hypothetical protein
MSVISQSAVGVKNPFASAFGISCLVLILVLAVSLHLLGVSLSIFFLLAGAAALLSIAIKYPLFGLGIVLAFMPVYPIAMLLGKFFGPSYMSRASGSDRGILLLFVFILLWRNGIRLKTPDWFLMGAFGLAVVRLVFGGTLLALLSDFNFMIAYAAGRLAALTQAQQRSWAIRAVWIAAALSIIGMIEIFYLGEGPRAALYLSVAEGGVAGEGLNSVFHADKFAGLRESSTMFEPLSFGSLCMFALILWWVYCRKAWLAVMVAAGLVCSLTRSAWLGTSLAIPLLAMQMKEKKRLFFYAAVALALFVATIPILGLEDYLTVAKAGEDYSTQGHIESIVKGLEFVWSHPFGAGPGNAGSYASLNNSNGVFIEDTYETLAAEYGIPSALLFVGFLVSSLAIAWRTRTALGYSVVGVLVGFGAVLVLAPLHQDFTLASWIWFPVGLLIRSAPTFQPREPDSPATYTLAIS